MDKYTVLIVDDNLQNLRVLASILGETDCDIGFAQNGTQALEFITEIKPDIILLDVMMPEMNGYEVCQKIKAQPGFEDLPIIFLTAKDERNDIIKGFEMGAVDYITKPFHNVELKMRIINQIKLKQHRDKLEAENRKLVELCEKLIVFNQELKKDNNDKSRDKCRTQ